MVPVVDNQTDELSEMESCGNSPNSLVIDENSESVSRSNSSNSDVIRNGIKTESEEETNSATSSTESSDGNVSPRVGVIVTNDNAKAKEEPKEEFIYEGLVARMHSNESFKCQPTGRGGVIISVSSITASMGKEGFKVPYSPGPVVSSSVGKDKARHIYKKSRRERDEDEPTSSMPELEFDGTTVLCRVCGDKASGFHYGVHSCEGCKGFFRRSIQQKIQYRPCTKNQQCSILRINRNRCQYCRLKKCIAVGMSRDAVRFGRVPKREKAKILAAMQSVSARSTERALAAELDDEEKFVNSVVNAHLETFEFTRDRIETMTTAARQRGDYATETAIFGCPLNPEPRSPLQPCSERFSVAIRAVVEFSKRIPGLSYLTTDDQMTLLKAGVFEVLLVRMAAMFTSETNTLLCLNGQLLRRDMVGHTPNARFLMDSMFDFAERLSRLRLTEPEVAIFCAIVVVATDRPGLRNVPLVEKMQQKLHVAFESMLIHTHAEQARAVLKETLRLIPDLRTLNTLHTEKLFSYRNTEQHTWSEQTWEDEARSPSGSVTSSDSVYSDLPLLAGVASSQSRLRPKSESSYGSDEEVYGMKSPGDSGFEDKVSVSSRSTTDSICSSPRYEECIYKEDMPVLKRVLQAPPLFDTNLLMDEAYKPHKKFRASRPEDCRAPQSALAASHSILARTLTEGPMKMTETQRRADVIVSNLMRRPYEDEYYYRRQEYYPPSSGYGYDCSIEDDSQPLNLSLKSPSPLLEGQYISSS